MTKLHSITFEEIGRLAVNEQGQLFWDGQPVITKKEVSLAWWVNAAAIVGAICIVITTIIETIRFFGEVP